MTKPPTRLVSIVVLLVSLLGVVALFLPFTSGVSPWDVLRYELGVGLTLLAAPSLLAVPILVWEVRRLIADRLGTGEVAAAYGLSVAAMPLVVGFLIWEGAMEAFSDVGMLIALTLYVAFVGANIVLLMRNRRAGLSREATAEAFLLGGYLPNAIFNLVLWGCADPAWPFSYRLNIGGYLIAVVCIGYVAAIVLLSREKPAGHHPPSDCP